MKIIQNFQVLSFKKGELDKKTGKLKKDRIFGVITPVLKDLNKEMIEFNSDDVMYFDTYMENVEKQFKAGQLYKGRFEIPRYIEKGVVQLKLIEIL